MKGSVYVYTHAPRLSPTHVHMSYHSSLKHLLRASTIALASLASSCSESPGSPDTVVDVATWDDVSDGSPEFATTSTMLEIARFEGFFDAEAGEFMVEVLPAEELPANFVGDGELRGVQQALYCPARVGEFGGAFELNTVLGSIGTTPVECLPASEISAWDTLFYAEGGAFCATVEATNRYETGVANVSAEIVEITSGAEGYRYRTNDPEPCCGTGADMELFPEGEGRPTDLNGGVFRFGDLEATEASRTQWTFRNPGTSFNFSGRIVMQMTEADNGIDDDCDGLIDEGLREFEDGADCDADSDCISGVCTGLGVCEVSCDPGYYGEACDPCPGVPAAVCGGNGSCDDNTGGSGVCSCDAGFAGSDCGECAINHFGSDCVECPSCRNGGTCVSGFSGDGTCECLPGFHGTSCDFSCADGVQNGTEDDVDCGGACDSCSCTDGILNGTEVNVDCGGSCEPCTPPPTLPPIYGTALVFEGNGNSQAVESATAAGLTVTNATNNVLTFNNALSTGSFDVVIYDNASTTMDSTSRSLMQTYVAGGGRLILSYFQLEAESTLLGTFGASVAQDFSYPRQVHPITQADGFNLFGYPNAVPAITSYATDGGDNGDVLAVSAPDGFIAANFDSAGSGAGAIAVTTGRRVIINGFMMSEPYTQNSDADATLDVRELYRNELEVVMGAVVAACVDGALNGSETDVDCGGALCGGCRVGEACGAHTDCLANSCDETGTCALPSCTDGIRNGTEGGVDCGGDCGPCPAFQIATMTTANCQVADHNAATGDDRGGIAIGPDNVFYTGDSRTARIGADSLTPITATSHVRDSFFSDLATGELYTLANATTPITYSGSRAVTAICELDATTLDVGACTTLSATLSLSGTVGIFASAGHVLLNSGSNWFSIELSTGVVTTVSTSRSMSSRNQCENWAFWGIGEFDSAGTWSAVYVYSNQIRRMDVLTGVVTTVATFSHLSDMCSITFDVARERWYYHHERSSQFGGSSETIGFCDGTQQCPVGYHGTDCSATCSDGELNGRESDIDCGGPCTPCAEGDGCAEDADCDTGLFCGPLEVCTVPSCTDGVANQDEEGVDCGGSCESDCPEFVLDTLTTANCRVIDHNSATGDDRGGIAVSNTHMFYTGDNATGRGDAQNLTSATSIGLRREALFSDVGTGRVYTLASGTTPMGDAGTVNSICLLEGENLTVGACVSLTTSIYMPYGSGIFGGAGRVLLNSGSNWYEVLLASGQVTQIRTGLSAPSHEGCENWAWWGIGEHTATGYSVVYSRGGSAGLARMDVTTGAVTSMGSFTNLSDMCSIAYNASAERWYFQHEGSSQLGGSSETMGYCDGSHICPDGFHGATCLFTCSDGLQNGNETALDCAGSCDACGLGLSCAANVDCESGYCAEGVCATPSCTDEVMNGDEEGLDCGGSCPNLCPTFGVSELTADNCRVVDINSLAGDDRGGIAVGTDYVYYTGDSRTARYAGEDLSGGSGMSTRFEALFSDYDTGRVYSLANGTTPLPYGGGTLNSICELDEETLTTGACTDLSVPFYIGGGTGIFPSGGRVYIYYSGTWRQITIATGEVETLRTGAYISYNTCESWAFWGIGEHDLTTASVLYSRGYSTGVWRFNITTGVQASAYSFSNLSDMCSISFDPRRSRWYFQHEYGSQFGGSSETLGYCDGQQVCADGTHGGECEFECDDAVLNGEETDVDCGGPCGSCALGESCGTNGDCESDLFCNLSDVCAVPSCTDSVANGDEEGVDCGGSCTAECPDFRMDTFTADNCVAIDHNSQSGDDRGGLAVGATNFYYTGDTSTVSGPLSDLTSATSLGMRRDALFSDVVTGRVYTLANGTTPLTTSGTANAICELIEPDLDVGGCTTLSTPLSLGSGTGIFSGAGRVILNYGSTWYEVLLSSGEVTTVRSGLSAPSHYGCENWAWWGIAEHGDAGYSVIYSRGSSAGIWRMTLATGAQERVGTFSNLSDMCSIGYSATQQRWYFHHEGTAQFGGGNETMGYCDAAHACAEGFHGAGCSFTCSDGVANGGELGPDCSGPCTATCGLGFGCEVNSDCTAGYCNESGVCDTPTCTDEVQNGTEEGVDCGGSCEDACPAFRIAELTTSNCRVVDHDSITGDDRGGIAVGTDYVYYTGDYRTGRFSGADLSGATGISPRRDALFSDLGSGQVYTLANGTTPLTTSGTISAICELDAATLALGACTDLTESFAVGGGTGIFSSAGRVIIYYGGTWREIALVSGEVTTLATGRTIPSYSSCENWAFWGIGEYGGEDGYSAIYSRGYSTGIWRFPIESGTPESIGTFSNLSDMCSITFDPRRSRWYFHHERGGQFGGLYETIGYCDGTRECQPETHGDSCEHTCSDGVQNGEETDVDCGGPCGGCGLTEACAEDADCESLYCGAGDVCVTPTCTDSMRNGTERGVDCGGDCPTECPGFYVDTLSSTGCHVADHISLTGDDRGGIAAGADYVYYSGDSRTGRFNSSDLSGGTGVTRRDSMFADVADGTVYSLANGTTPLGQGGTVNAICQLNPTTLDSVSCTSLSTTISMGYGSGVFPSTGRVILRSGSTWYEVLLATGTVTTIRTGLGMPSYMSCENWAHWGIGEWGDDGYSVVYSRGYSSGISRLDLTTGTVTSVGSFTALSDMCSIAYDLGRDRWYFHHEYSGQFGGSSETIGYCPATSR